MQPQVQNKRLVTDVLHVEGSWLPRLRRRLLFILFLIMFFSVTVDIQYHFMVVSGVQHRVRHLYNLHSSFLDQSSIHRATNTIVAVY